MPGEGKKNPKTQMCLTKNKIMNFKVSVGFFTE